MTKHTRAAGAAALLATAAILGLAGCGDGLLQAGGNYSGVPDTPIGVGRAQTLNTGYIRNDGTVVLNRDTGNYQPYPRR